MILAFVAGATVLAFGVLIGVSVVHSSMDKILNNPKGLKD